MSYVLYKVEGNEKKLRLSETETVIGRSHEASVRLRHDTEVSRVHCKITRRDEGFFLQHCSNKNPTRLNGKSVSGAEVRLKDGDRIAVGAAEITFCESADQPTLLERLTGLFGRKG